MQSTHWQSLPSAIWAWFAQGKRHWLALAILIAAAAAFHLLCLTRTPEVTVDEAWLASRALGLIQTGRPFGILDSGVMDRFDGYWASYPLLLTGFQALAIRLLGLGVFSVRLVSLIFGLVLLVLVYITAAHLGGRRVGLLAVVLTALSDTFYFSGHMARQDIIVAAFGFATIALYVTDEGSSLSAKSVLSGLLVGLALDVHLTASYYGATIVTLYLLEHGWRTVRLPRFWGMAGGACAGILVYAVVHILPYPSTYLAAIRLMLESARMPPMLVLDPRVWIESATGIVILLVWSGKPWLTIPGAVWLLRRGRGSEKRIVALFAALLIAFVALMQNKTMLYAIMVSPGANVLAAAFAVKTLDQRRDIRVAEDGRLRLVYRILVAATCATLVLDTGLMTLDQLLIDHAAEHRDAVSRIRALIPAGSTVMGSQTYWFAMPDERYLSWQELVYYQRYRPGSTLGDALREFRPRFLIIDDHMARWIVYDKAQAPRYYEELYLPRLQWQRFLARQGRLVACFKAGALGIIRIYELRWT